MTQMSFLIFLIFLVGLLFLSNLMFSEKELEVEQKQNWFESGIENKMSSRETFSIQFFMVCLIFVMFDLEIVFLFSYILKLGHFFLLKYIILFLVFFNFLYMTLVYEWNLGTISWSY